MAIQSANIRRETWANAIRFPPVLYSNARRPHGLSLPPKAGFMLRLNAHVAIAITVLAIVAPCRWVNASPRDPLDEARALLATGDLDRAAQKVTQVIADAPHRGVAHLVLGLVCYRDGRYEDALAEFALARTCAVPALPGPTMFNEGARA